MERANLQIMQMMRERGADVLCVSEHTYGEKVRHEVERIGCQWATASFEQRLHLTKHPREMAVVLYAWGKAAWEVRRIYEAYQPTHIHVTNLTYLLYTLPILRHARQPVIFNLPNPPDNSLPTLKQHLSNWIWRYCVAPVCDVMVCNSHYTRSQLETVGIKLEKVRTIYNCLPERTSTQVSDVPKLPPDHFNIVFIGQVTPAKGVREFVDTALRITSERHDVDFYIAGDHEWQNPFAKGLIEEVNAKHLGSRIRFVGEIADVFGLLSQCDLHVCPSVFEEPFGLVVLEAKSQGIPSVVFPSGGLQETVAHRVDGYICNDKSTQALYEGIRYFLDDAVALQAAGKAAKRSLERFSRECMTDAWADIFKNIS
jgi:glycosyltransferase involved in cell wall biosynthesis